MCEVEIWMWFQIFQLCSVGSEYNEGAETQTGGQFNPLQVYSFYVFVREHEQ